MFIGQTSNWLAQKRYLPKALVLAFEEMRGYDLEQLDAGNYNLASVGGAFFVLQTGLTKPANTTQAEVHRSFIDIQYLVTGQERVGMAQELDSLNPIKDNRDTEDYALYAPPDHEFFIDLQAEQFIVFFPGELHRPFLCYRNEAPSPIRKVVVKVPNKAIA